MKVPYFLRFRQDLKSSGFYPKRIRGFYFSFGRAENLLIIMKTGYFPHKTEKLIDYCPYSLLCLLLNVVQLQ